MCEALRRTLDAGERWYWCLFLQCARQGRSDTRCAQPFMAGHDGWRIEARSSRNLGSGLNSAPVTPEIERQFISGVIIQFRSAQLDPLRGYFRLSREEEVLSYSPSR